MFPDYMIVWKYLRQLPSAQQWIPCSERLPEEHGEYLCTLIGFRGEPYVRTLFYGTSIMLSDFDDEPYWYAMTRDEDFKTDSVTAWMPLPQPWKGEKDECTN